MVPAVAGRLTRLAGREFWTGPEDLVFANELGTLAVRRAEVPAVQAWMGHSDIQTTMRYVDHRDRGDEAKLLAEAFRPAGTFGDVWPEMSRNVPR